MIEAGQFAHKAVVIDGASRDWTGWFTSTGIRPAAGMGRSAIFMVTMAAT